MPDNPNNAPNEDARDHDQRLTEAFQLLLTNAFDVVLILDREGVILYASPAIEHFLGYQPDQLLGRGSDEFVHDDDLSNARAMMRGVLENGGRSGYTEFRIRDAEDSWHWVESVAQNLLDHEYIKGIVLNYRDITDRKRTEDALRRSEARYAMAFRNSPDSITITDTKNWNLIEANQGFVDITGYELHDMIGRTAEDIGLWRDVDKRDAFRKMLLENRSVRDFEVELIDKHGNVLTTHVSAELIDIDGESYSLAVTRDVTSVRTAFEELKSTADQLQAERKTLEEKNIALKQVLDTISSDREKYRHELCAEIDNVMMPILERLRRSGDAIPQSALDELEAGIHRITEQDMDDFQNNVSKLTPRELDIMELIKEGLSSKEIAERLGLSDQTIHKHRNTIRRKLQLHNKNINLAAYLRSR